METEVLFSAAIRVVGLMSFGRGFLDLVYVVLLMTGVRDSSVTDVGLPPNLYYGSFYFLAGLYLIRGAPFLMRFAFPKEPNNSGSTEREDDPAQE
jgi:hypothetical protein